MKAVLVIISALCVVLLSSCDRLKDFAGITEGVEDVLEQRVQGEFGVVVGDSKLVNQLKAESEAVVVVDYYSDACGPCRAMAPSVEKMAKQYGEKVLIIKVDLGASGENQTYAASEGVKGIPTLDFFIEGKKVKRLVGGMDEGALNAIFSDVVAQSVKDESGAASRVVLQPVKKDRLPAGVVRVKNTNQPKQERVSVETGKMTPLHVGGSN